MGEIVLKNINKNYGGEQLFNNLNLRFETGKITAVMGPSGLGKTTLLRIMLGLEDFEGSIGGMEGMRIGVMFQDNLLMPWLTLRENIELIAGISAATDEALKLTELEDAADKKPAELS
ncbi:MAG: ATP-binding cassette domain-containing protein, partial [Clostridiales bacterium]|nr:ATP-binding cassette domain-containing protein [Clostridiales bacterium]